MSPAARPRRVLMVAPQPFYSDRGTPMNVLQMCRVLTSEGWEVDLLTFPLGRDVTLPGLRIRRCPRLPGLDSIPIGFSAQKVVLDMALFAMILWYLVTRRYDVIHTIEESVFLALPFTLFGLPLIYDLDSLISDQLEYTGVISNPRLLGMVRSLERLALRRSRVAITVCQSLTDAAQRLVPGVQIHQIEDVPLEEASRDPDPRRVAELRSEFVLDRARVILYTGNLESYQGIHLLLDATARIPTETDAKVVLVGGTDEAVAALRADIERRRLGGRILLVGARPPYEMAEWMALADVLVSPRTEGENTPLKIYSYMRSGTPIVATRKITHTQVLSDETARLCEPSPTAMASALLEELSGGPESIARGAAAKRLAIERFSFEGFRRKLIAAYEEAISSSD